MANRKFEIARFSKRVGEAQKHSVKLVEQNSTCPVRWRLAQMAVHFAEVAEQALERYKTNAREQNDAVALALADAIIEDALLRCGAASKRIGEIKSDPTMGKWAANAV